MGIQDQQKADAVEMLKKDHEEVMKLFERFEGASADEKGGLAQHIYRELEVHATLEEEIFYPAVRDQVDLKTVLEGEDKSADEDESQDTEDIIAISYEEHKTVKELIAQQRQLNPTSDEFKERFAEMKEAVQDHAGEEEETIFPAAQMKLDLQRLGEQMRQRKEHLTSSKVA
jgi:hemerythrin superfamily protein